MSRKIVLGVTAGIAAYKSVVLARELMKANYQVQVVMTLDAKKFIGELTFAGITNRAVKSELLNSQAEDAMAHINLARWADIVVIAPASANFIAKLAGGFADNLLSCLCLASDKPIVVAPAMNKQMWQASASQHNIKVLQSRGIEIIMPGSGEQACGEFGAGRMQEPVEIFNRIENFFLIGKSKKVLANSNWLVTAGPTYEDIDPVRYITNRSSGKMGISLVESLANSGAKVHLVCGPVNIDMPKNCQVYKVRTGNEMFAAVKQLLQKNKFDGFIGNAAVVDFAPKKTEKDKIKKRNVDMFQKLEFEKNPDILKWVGHLKNNRPSLVMGFAAETEELQQNALAKLNEKNADWICANKIQEGQAMESDNNSVTLFSKTEKFDLPLMAKKLLADKIVDKICKKRS